MSFLNEGEEPRKTIESIFSTASSDLLDIIAIDDASKDQYDDLADLPNVKYYRNSKRKGVQASKNQGVQLSETPYILLIDAHMRFKNDNWLEKILNNLESEPNTVFGTVCVELTSDDEKITETQSRGYGATLTLLDKSKSGDTPKEIIAPKWMNRSRWMESPNNELPCVLGACYAFSREFFLKIKGLEGLKMWGSTEAYLSMKTWMAGGKCKLLEDIEVGHKFRSKAPYDTNDYFRIYNKLFICKTLFDQELEKIMLGYIPQTPHLKLAEILLEKNNQYIQNLNAYFKNTFQFTARDYFDKFKIIIPN
jgi:glycosyltransferase involved in cell wall biosynthesis